MKGDLFSNYAVGKSWDEIFERTGHPREVAVDLYETLRTLSLAEFNERCLERDRSLRDRGVTFALSGEELPFPLDPIPRLIEADEWATIEAGVTQRVRALELFLADAYGPGEIFNDGVMPRRHLATSHQFHRAAYAVETPNQVRIHVAGIDLVRDRDGGFQVVEDNVRTPSGSSYVLENRRTMARVFPELFASHPIHPVDDYCLRLRTALQHAAPRHAADIPAIVVLTPGVHNSAYFEHSFLARQMGVELVEGRDLFCRNNVVYMRTTASDVRVDIVYRRVDDEFLDPVQFRPDSLLGCAGIVNAARAGNVTIANAVGNGIADDKLTYTYVPEIINYYLGEKPVLPNITTYRLENPMELEYALEHIESLVVKPVDGSGGYGIVIGPTADDQTLQETAEKIRRSPRNYIAQDFVDISTAPTKVGDEIVPCHVDFRPFAINDGEKVWVVPGGLTRVALRQGSTVVNSSQGGGSKDTWVIAAQRDRSVETAENAPVEPTAPIPFASSEPESGPRFSASQQQQQQQRSEGPGIRSMLSRIAESFFWTGRYLERADDTARILDVQIHRLLEEGDAHEAETASSLLAVMGIPAIGGEALSVREVTRRLAISEAQDNSIVSSLRSARENARGIRESISSEFWECLNATTVELAGRAPMNSAIGPHQFFQFAHYVRDRVALAGGIADATMSRDEGWQFLILGRNIERVDMTARLLGTRANELRSNTDWGTTLRSCSAYEAYLRSYRGVINAPNVTEFLLLDRSFPRSIYVSLATAEGCLLEIEQIRNRADSADEAHRIIGRARADLQFRTIEDVLAGFSELLLSLQESCAQASSAIATRYFQREGTLVWRTDGSSLPSMNASR